MTRKTIAVLEAEVATLTAKLADADACAARALAGRDQMIAENAVLMRENQELRRMGCKPDPVLADPADSGDIAAIRRDRDKWMLRAQIAGARLRLVKLSAKDRG